jgi:hypothetical protein
MVYLMRRFNRCIRNEELWLSRTRDYSKAFTYMQVHDSFKVQGIYFENDVKNNNFKRRNEISN